MYTIHMKRTNLVLNEELLKTATRLLGAKTYSEAVNRSLEDSIRNVKARGILGFIGKDVWQGDLAQMREDQSPAQKNPQTKAKLR